MQLGLQLTHLSGMLLAEFLLPCLQGMLAGVVAGPWQHMRPASLASDVLPSPCSRCTWTLDLMIVLGWYCPMPSADVAKAACHVCPLCGSSACIAHFCPVMHAPYVKAVPDLLTLCAASCEALSCSSCRCRR